MAGFDLAMGMLVLRRSLARALEDFDPRTGNLLLVGLFWLALARAGSRWLPHWCGGACMAEKRRQPSAVQELDGVSATRTYFRRSMRQNRDRMG
jgi:hypothetical protein